MMLFIMLIPNDVCALLRLDGKISMCHLKEIEISLINISSMLKQFSEELEFGLFHNMYFRIFNGQLCSRTFEAVLTERPFRVQPYVWTPAAACPRNAFEVNTAHVKLDNSDADILVLLPDKRAELGMVGL